jgi:hypothetical protein
MRALAAVLVLVVAAVPLGLAPSAVAAAPRCFGKPATHVMKIGDPLYAGTASDDVVVGSKGADSIFLQNSGGVDRVCSGGGNDHLAITGTGSIADGGAGNDVMTGYEGATLRGGTGNDAVVADGTGGRAEGGSGDDEVTASSGAIADGGSGNDEVRASLHGSAAALYGGSGRDRVIDDSFLVPKIDCGSGRDEVDAGGATSVKNCEVTFFAP